MWEDYLGLHMSNAALTTSKPPAGTKAQNSIVISKHMKCDIQYIIHLLVGGNRDLLHDNYFSLSYHLTHNFTNDIGFVIS